jgi:hypothetical protein
MSLISYVKIAMNKRLLISESRGDSNRCAPCKGKPDTHDTYASRVNPHMPHVCFLRAEYIPGNLSVAINSVGWTLLLLRKGAPNTIPSTSVDQSIGPSPSFSSNTTIEVVMKAKHQLTTCYISLSGP